MKELSSNKEGAQWSNNLLYDLSFIKKHLRYPISKKTIPPFLLLLVATVYMSRAFIGLLFLGKVSGASVRLIIPGVFVMLMIIVLARLDDKPTVTKL